MPCSCRTCRTATGRVAIGVVTVALIASVESLLCAVATDRMHTGPRTDFNRELIGQGTANIASGVIGGLPITGVIVRSSTNIHAGAKSRASAILHGVWVLLFSLPFAGLVEQIPTAALAGLLIVIGIRLLQPAHIETARRNGDFVVYLVTVLGVVFFNLLHGVLIGLALAIALTGWRVIRAKVEAKEHADDEWHVRVDGRARSGPAPADRSTGVYSRGHRSHCRPGSRLPRPCRTSGDPRLAAPASGHRWDGAHQRSSLAAAVPAGASVSPRSASHVECVVFYVLSRWLVQC
ncbi:permease family protein [Mycobacterium xenopi 3993]|nr:permease family protein [Mycobacterium xenopi 3993]